MFASGSPRFKISGERRTLAITSSQQSAGNIWQPKIVPNESDVLKFTFMVTNGVPAVQEFSRETRL
jgi:hypothetical protein